MVVPSPRIRNRSWTVIPTQIGDIPTTSIPIRDALHGETIRISWMAQSRVPFGGILSMSLLDTTDLRSTVLGPQAAATSEQCRMAKLPRSRHDQWTPTQFMNLTTSITSTQTGSIVTGRLR